MVKALQNAVSGRLDVYAVVKFFGGRQALVNDLKRYEIIELSATAVDKWQLRGNIPAARRIDLQTLASLKKQKFNFSLFATKAAAKKKAA